MSSVFLIDDSFQIEGAQLIFPKVEAIQIHTQGGLVSINTLQTQRYINCGLKSYNL
jgi:hypothetical protein